MNRSPVLSATLAILLAVTAASCGSADDIAAPGSDVLETGVDTAVAADESGVELEVIGGAADDEIDSTAETLETVEPAEAAVSGAASSFEIEVWADNWMAVYVDGRLIGEDSVPITTERSFNAESFTFEASLPFTIAIEAKDFKETDSGIEYIGEGNQQMGDGGIIAQVTDLATGEVVAGTDAGWSALVVHQAPLNTECERDADPDSTCEFLITDTPVDWTAAEFDDTDWSNATVWSAADVSPKDGYDEISWDPSAQLVWGADLEVDNTVLLRTTVS